MVSTQELRSLGEQGLAELLLRRPDVLVPRPPHDLSELAIRLSHPYSLTLALRGLNLPTLQVAEALAALGPDADREQLDALLGLHPPGSDAAVHVGVVDAGLAALAAQLLIEVRVDCAILEGSEDTAALRGRVRLVPEAASLWSRPLGLGPRLATLLSERTAGELQSALRALGRRAPTRRTQLIDELVAVLGDPDTVGDLVAAAPPEVSELLRSAAFGRPVRSAAALPGFWPQQARRDPARWAVDRMLLVPAGWYDTPVMPAEVALALRGPHWHAPFTPEPPCFAWGPIAERLVERESAAASAHAVRTVAGVLQQIGDTPVSLLKSGGVGVRELRRVAKLVGCRPAEVRLALALGFWADLVGVEQGRLAPTVDFDAWLVKDPASRFADLVEAWIDLPETTMQESVTAWAPQSDAAVGVIRVVALDTMSRHPAGAPASVEELARLVLWTVPMCRSAATSQFFDPRGEAYDDAFDDSSVEPFAPRDHVGLDHRSGPVEDQVAGERESAVRSPVCDMHSEQALREVTDTLGAVLTEAAWLGLTGAGALSASGAAMLAGEDVAGAAEAGLGAVQETARLQADLTAVVLGHASARLTEVLDRIADRESRSAAGTWRFSPVSIRRAMDGGLDEATILQMLSIVAEDDVPQPLRYLVTDVARRHGRLRVGEVAAYLRCDDETLVCEVLADRSLRSLDLRRIAPTVLGAAAPPATVLAVLRAAGHLPVAEDDDGAVRVERQESRRVQPVPDLPVAAGLGLDVQQPSLALDLEAIVGGLLARPDEPDRLYLPAEGEEPDGVAGGNVIDMAAFEEMLRRRDS